MLDSFCDGNGFKNLLGWHIVCTIKCVFVLSLNYYKFVEIR